MRATPNNTFAAFLLCILLLAACRKEKTYWEDDFVAPLAHGNLTLGTMFPDTTIKSNPDSTLKIAFESEVVNYALDSLLKLPDTTVVSPTTFSAIGIPVQIGPCTQLMSSSAPGEDTYFPIKNGVQLRKAIVRSGAIDFTIRSTCRLPIVYTYTLNSASQNNITFTKTFNIPAGSKTNPSIVTYTLDLAGYTIDFSGGNHNTYNTITQNYKANADCAAQPDTLFPNDSLVLQYTFKSLVPQYAQGYFGNQTVSVGPDTTTFSVFNTIQSGMLNLNSATVGLKIVNEFGVAMRASVGSLTSISTANQQTVTINAGNSSPLATPINIGNAYNTGTGAIAATKTVTLTSTNTPNLTNFIGILSDKFAYSLTAQVNPPPVSNSGGNNDFAYYGTAFRAFLDADIPLFFSASNILLADTVPLSLTSVNQFNNINHGQLLLTATNSYPFSIDLQGYLLDENKSVIDVLFASPTLVQAPPLDANNKVTAPLKSTLTVPLTQTKIKNLQNAKYVCYTAKFNTASQPAQIKFYNYYTLDLLLTADINYTIGK